MNQLTTKQINVLKAVDAWADQFHCIRTVYVYGSFARGCTTPNDIDIAIEYTEEVHHACYREVNQRTDELTDSVKTITSVPVKLTGVFVLSGYQGYDHVAWDAIHAGTKVGSCGKAQMICTKPKP